MVINGLNDKIVDQVFSELENSGLFERIRQKADEVRAKNKNRAGVRSAQVALFWFSNDYKTVSRVEDERYFDNYPEESNRGRICLNNGIVEIWVGQDCPDVMVEKVKFLFGINRIDDAPVKVYKDRSYDSLGSRIE